MAENIKVVLRVKPLSKSEAKANLGGIIKYASDDEVLVNNESHKFDKIFKPECSQAEVFNYLAAPLIPDVLAGYNCTILAYGETGSGKSYTMCGPNCSNARSWIENTQAGLLPRSIDGIMKQIQGLGPHVTPTVAVSFIELYNEKVVDLLSDNVYLPSLNLYYVNKTLCIQNLNEVKVKNCGNVFNLYKKGLERCEHAPTLMNHQRSKSHKMFTITVTLDHKNGSGHQSYSGKLNLVDLAGSENAAKTTETGNLNKSLVALGRVLELLGKKSGLPVPFGDSKLTRILQDSLGGSARTLMIATIVPLNNHLEETRGTLECAQLARNIQNSPQVHKQTISENEIVELQKELDESRASKTDGFYMHPSSYNAFREEMKAYKTGIEAECQALASQADYVAKKTKRNNLKRKEVEEKKAAMQVLDEQIEEQLKNKQQLDRTIKQDMADLVNSKKNQEQLRANKENLLQEARKESERAKLLHNKKEQAINMSHDNQAVAQGLLKTVENTAPVVEKLKNAAMAEAEGFLCDFKNTLDQVQSDTDKVFDFFYRQIDANIYPEPSSSTSTQTNCKDTIDKMLVVKLEHKDFVKKQIEQGNQLANEFSGISQLDENLKNMEINEPNQEIVDPDEKINQDLVQIREQIKTLSIQTNETMNMFPKYCASQQNMSSEMVKKLDSALINKPNKSRKSKEEVYKHIRTTVLKRHKEIGAKIQSMKDSFAKIDKTCLGIESHTETLNAKMQEVDANRFFYVRYVDNILTKKMELLAWLNQLKEVLQDEEKQLDENLDTVNNYSSSVNDMLHEMEIVVNSFKKKIEPVARVGDTPVLRPLTELNLNTGTVPRSNPQYNLDDK